MRFYENVHRLRDGAILVYTRQPRKRPTYQARLKIPGVRGYVSNPPAEAVWTPHERSADSRR
jgi:hypothetical protein